MDGDIAIATTYDVLVYADLDTRLGVEKRWLIAGSHASRIAAGAQYRDLEEEFPNPRVKILIVASVHDRATGLFKDRIVRARETAPLIDRRSARKMHAEDRVRLSKALTETAPRRAPPPAPAPDNTRLWWVAGAAVAGAAAAAGAGLALLL